MGPPWCATMTPELLDRIGKLVAAGATVKEENERVGPVGDPLGDRAGGAVLRRACETPANGGIADQPLRHVGRDDKRRAHVRSHDRALGLFDGGEPFPEPDDLRPDLTAILTEPPRLNPAASAAAAMRETRCAMRSTIDRRVCRRRR